MTEHTFDVHAGFPAAVNGVSSVKRGVSEHEAPPRKAMR